jgi:hypothetical protein
MRVTLRSTIAADLPHVVGEPLPYRIRAITALAGDKVIGLGGLAFPPNGTVWAFVQQSEDAKRYPAAIHRAGLMAMRMIRDSGLAEVVATADADSAAARRWLRRLGFVEAGRQDIAGQMVFLWRSSNRSGPAERNAFNGLPCRSEHASKHAMSA